MQSILIGLVTGFVCNYSVRLIHPIWKVDDTLDVFSSHGIGGLVGSLMVGIFHESDNTFMAYSIASWVVILYTVLMSYMIYRLVNYKFKARAFETIEEVDLDVSEHGEKIINL